MGLGSGEEVPLRRSLSYAWDPWYGTLAAHCLGTWRWWFHTGCVWQVAPCTGPGVVSEVAVDVDMAALLASVAPLYKWHGFGAKAVLALECVCW